VNKSFWKKYEYLITNSYQHRKCFFAIKVYWWSLHAGTYKRNRNKRTSHKKGSDLFQQTCA